ncbi:MAG: hypothetical protein JST47_04670 [Bacteroidetes bacterium]|nr:hypothetical protein [Bacteroidota bacterium]MBS1974624.1 hypothetical protein [Bacteroidota bacterium]
MKKNLLITATLAISITRLYAQHSCDNAYRFDASYAKAFDQLDNVTIFLSQPKPTAEASRAKENITGPYYYTSGATSGKSFQPVDANIGFTKCYVLQPNLELYKADVKNGMRTFTIPAGWNGNRCVDIPIQIITPPGTANNERINWGPGNFKIKFLNGYLQSGEYILIDKNSISPDGSQMKGYAFTIK